MEQEDRITFATPEGIELELPLAGLGSRFVAQLLDLLLTGVVIGALVLVVGLTAGLDNTTAGLLVFAFVLIQYAYEVAFEVLAAGRTPGKRANGLRVILLGGEPVRLPQSLVRNLMRVIEGLPTLYVPAAISILVTRRNQRLGDLAAGTVVIRDEDEEALTERRARRRGRLAWNAPPSAAVPLAAWDVTAVSGQEVAAVRQFLARRATLLPDARRRLGDQLAAGVRDKVAGADPGLDSEALLEALDAAKAARA